MNNADVNRPSNKKFGRDFSIIFSIAFLYCLYKSLPVLSISFAILALATLLVTLMSPDRLEPFNLLWFKIGILLGKIVNPLVLGVIFFGVITPVAIFMRLSGRDELSLKAKGGPSFWKDRSSPTPGEDSFNNQF